MAHPRDVRLVRAIALGRVVRRLPGPIAAHDKTLRGTVRLAQDARLVRKGVFGGLPIHT